MEGKTKSAFGMTEKGVASSDATNIITELRIDSSDPNFYILNGRKWWSSNAGHPNLSFFIVLCK